MKLLQVPSPFEKCEWPQKVLEDFRCRNLQLFVKRDDLIHPEISGNKWRKLRLNVEKMKQLEKRGILTFGGAFSNHLLATAAAGKMLGFQTIGWVRGEELTEESNSNLQKCAALGMKLTFVDRMRYTLRNDWDFLQELKSEYSQFHIVPEGGANALGVWGCQDILKEIKEPFHHIWTASGTGTTAVGIASGLQTNQELKVVNVVKGFNLETGFKAIHQTCFGDSDWADETWQRLEVVEDEQQLKYGQVSPELNAFIEEMKGYMPFDLESIYTAKTFRALLAYYKNHPEIEDTTIVFLHTGGLFNHKS